MHIIRYDAPLPIGRPCQEIGPRLSGKRVWVFDGVSDGIDVRIGCLQVFIHLDSACRSDSQLCISCQLRIRTHSDRQKDEFGLDFFARVKRSSQYFSPFFNTFHRFAQIETNTFFLQVGMNDRCHREIHRCHYLWSHLDDIDSNASGM